MQNAVGVGSTAAVMFAYGAGDVLFCVHPPHGLLELTSIFVAAAAGLRIFWAWVAPGPRTRGEALAEDGPVAVRPSPSASSVTLAVSGIIEGFVTRRAWPWPVKIGDRRVALAAFLVYMLVVGRRAYRAGETGDLTEYERGSRAPRRGLTRVSRR